MVPRWTITCLGLLESHPNWTIRLCFNNQAYSHLQYQLFQILKQVFLLYDHLKLLVLGISQKSFFYMFYPSIPGSNQSGWILTGIRPSNLLMSFQDFRKSSIPWFSSLGHQFSLVSCILLKRPAMSTYCNWDLYAWLMLMPLFQWLPSEHC